MTRATAWAIGGVTAALLVMLGLVGAYFYNPYHTASRDPRARLLGVLTYSVPDDGMLPNLRRGDFVFIDTKMVRALLPRAGEVIAYEPPGVANIRIGRVVATGGSTIEIRDGVVVVNGTALRERYVLAPADGETGAVEPLRKLPRDSYYVLGDNRALGEDSRAFGPVPRDRLVGRVLVITRTKERP
jgi:signal peptidase I